MKLFGCRNAAIGNIFAASLLLAAVVADGATARRRRRNPRRDQAAQAAGPKADALAPGRWDPAVRRAIEAFAAENGSASPRYNPAEPPIAVLPVDAAVIDHDIAESAFQRMAERIDFKIDEAFWSVVPAAFGRQALRSRYEELLAAPVSAWRSQPAYRQLRKGFISSYRELCVRTGAAECRRYLARLFHGFTVEEAAVYARETMALELARPPEAEIVQISQQDPRPLTIRSGLRVVPEFRDFIGFLDRAGFETWLVSSDYQALVAEAAQAVGIPRSRAVGAKLEISTSTAKMRGRELDPFPWGAGKVAAVSEVTGKVPAVVFGADESDGELLRYGTGLRVWLDRGRPGSRAEAEARGWLVQPAFAP